MLIILILKNNNNLTSEFMKMSFLIMDFQFVSLSFKFVTGYYIK